MFSNRTGLLRLKKNTAVTATNNWKEFFFKPHFFVKNLHLRGLSLIASSFITGSVLVSVLAWPLSMGWTWRAFYAATGVSSGIGMMRLQKERDWKGPSIFKKFEVSSEKLLNQVTIDLYGMMLIKIGVQQLDLLVTKRSHCFSTLHPPKCSNNHLNMPTWNHEIIRKRKCVG